ERIMPRLMMVALAGLLLQPKAGTADEPWMEYHDGAAGYSISYPGSWTVVPVSDPLTLALAPRKSASVEYCHVRFFSEPMPDWLSAELAATMIVETDAIERAVQKSYPGARVVE
ncbi:MAG: hypothetical protein AB7P12_07990, partial [Alphaproteobacteria bacterium]